MVNKCNHVNRMTVEVNSNVHEVCSDCKNLISCEMSTVAMFGWMFICLMWLLAGFGGGWLIKLIGFKYGWF